MKLKAISVAAAAAIVMTGSVITNEAQAFNFGNMMNPSRWFGGNDDNWRYRRGYGPYGYGGYGPYGYGGYGPYGYGGYGPYGGWGGYPGYGGGGYPSTIVVNPGGSSKSSPRLPE